MIENGTKYVFDEAGVSPQNILSVAPRSRNSLLADIAKRIGLAERTGRGVDRIFEGVLRYGRRAPQYTFGDYEVGLFLPNEKADFRFLDFVNELERNLRRPVSVDLLLVLSRLILDVTLTLREILTLTQREEGLVVKELGEWEKMGLIWKDSGSESYSLTQLLNKRLKDHSAYVRQTEGERATNIQRIKSFLAREGTIRRAKVMEICNLTEKQASDMLAKLLENSEIILEGKGRATTYRLAR